MTMKNPQHEARIAALAARDDHPIKPTSIVQYQSAGRVIVLADGESWHCCKELGEPLQPVVVLMSSDRPYASSDAQIIPLGSRSVHISGHLGAFEVRLVDSLGHAETLNGDMILDLGQTAQEKSELPRPGYLHVSGQALDVTEIESQLKEMVGTFEKPRYFTYDPSICAHGVNGNTVCSSCVDACPAGAIASVGEKIEVDPHLCQGGGTCATVCPSGAIRYAYPALEDAGNRIRRMLGVFREQGGENPIVLFHQQDHSADHLIQQHSGVLPIAVEEVASVGMDLCLSSLVFGAAQVVLMADEEAPDVSISQLRSQLEWLGALLEAVGLDSKCVTLIGPNDEIPRPNVERLIPPAEYSMPASKRHALLQAVDHLYQQVEKTRELVTLPAGAPFGNATIDEKACTLCMACVSACPGKALQDGSNREMPEVLFVESNCLQCGACTVTCPEQAIYISPRLLLDREKRNRARVLNQDTPFSCISCGKPFAPSSTIHKMLFQLKGHHMFQTNRALERLKMCEDCRVADIVQDPDALNGNFDPINSSSGKGIP